MLLNALVADFEEFGPAAVRIMRVERPSDYCRLVASLVPKEMIVQESALAGMTDEELAEHLAAVRRLRARAATMLADQITPSDETKH
jgi:hypothetical protein